MSVAITPVPAPHTTSTSVDIIDFLQQHSNTSFMPKEPNEKVIQEHANQLFCKTAPISASISKSKTPDDLTKAYKIFHSFLTSHDHINLVQSLPKEISNSMKLSTKLAQHILTTAISEISTKYITEQQDKNQLQIPSTIFESTQRKIRYLAGAYLHKITKRLDPPSHENPARKHGSTQWRRC